jgi:hypothetical protein
MIVSSEFQPGRQSLCFLVCFVSCSTPNWIVYRAAFYVQVELKQHPSLVGKPVGVVQVDITFVVLTYMLATGTRQPHLQVS